MRCDVGGLELFTVRLIGAYRFWECCIPHYVWCWCLLFRVVGLGHQCAILNFCLCWIDLFIVLTDRSVYYA